VASWCQEAKDLALDLAKVQAELNEVNEKMLKDHTKPC